MTEQEAKTKWCPFVRYVVIHQETNAAVNRWMSTSDKQLNPEPAHCIGSDCMAWRQTSEYQHPNEHIKTGYCGLAGKP